MTDKPRGICSECGKEVSLKKDGTCRGHGYTQPTWVSGWCKGSMEKPKEIL